MKKANNVSLGNKGQMIVGYLLVFVLVIAALMVMGSYIRNSMSGKIRSVGDSIGGGEQYDPGPGYGHYHTGASTDTTITDAAGGHNTD
jgi:hypothetical protein